MLASARAGSKGTNSLMLIQVRAPTSPTTANIHRHPSCCPIQVTTGTPRTFAMESPSITQAIARPRMVAGTNEPARMAARPK